MDRASGKTAKSAAAKPTLGKTADNEPVIRLNTVGVRYGRGPEALSDINLQLPPGSFHFLTGPSGAGKSTLMRLIYLAQKPSRGLVTVFGIDAARASRKTLAALRRRIGVVFQDFHLLEHLSVFDNVALPLRIENQPLKSYRDDVEELLTWVGLKDRMDASPQTLSGGEKQRAAIARAIVGKPDLILADEPTGNVDHEMGARLMRLFVQLNKLGSTVVIATHDLELVHEIGAPVLRLEHGRLNLQDGGVQPNKLTPRRSDA
jgi:cell division transport system ATP-binding protein